MSEIALQLRGVTKRFVSRDRVVEALAPVDLDIRQGEFVCLLGASGCGKSTLLNLIAGLETLTAGSITAHGKQIDGTGVDRVMMFQDAALFPWLTVQSNVEFGLRQSNTPAAERKKIAKYWLERVHLAQFDDSVGDVHDQLHVMLD